MPTFFGAKMSQNPQDFIVWEAFFEQYPIKSFLEFGTDHGGMTYYFALQCYQRRIIFHTVDHQDWMDWKAPIAAALNLHDCFHLVDIFSIAGITEIGNLITGLPKPLCIFFDDGNKPREWATYAPMASPGDFCVVHDWNDEFFEKDLGDVPVERILTQLSDERVQDWIAMWFMRT